MTKHLLASALFGAVALLGSAVTAHANLIINAPTTGTPANPTDQWQLEAGQGIPTGTGGTVDGTLAVTSVGLYKFQYGPLGLVAGTTGHGDSINLNEFWVGATEAAAIAAHDVFCTQPGIAAYGGVANRPRRVIHRPTGGRQHLLWLAL